MTVYHGTGACSVQAILDGKAFLSPRHYLRRRSFSTTTSFDVASIFAVRKTPAVDFRRGEITGAVIEFELSGAEGKDFAPARDPSCMQEEQEIAVFNIKALKPVATYRHVRGRWTRTL